MANILVVDGDKEARATAQNVLKESGHTVVAVDSYDAALRALKKPGHGFEVLVGDFTFDFTKHYTALQTAGVNVPIVMEYGAREPLILRGFSDSSPPIVGFVAKSPSALRIDLPREVTGALSQGRRP